MSHDTKDSLLSKVEKGRLKKLKGRAVLSQGSCSSNSPGITCYDDAYELRSLLKKLNPNESKEDVCPWGPSIDHFHSNHLDFSDPQNWKLTEGSDHGNLIQSLLLGTMDAGSSKNDSSNEEKKKIMTKKRKHENSDEESTRRENSPPSWARLHNMALTQNVAVIEFAISLPNDESLTVMPSCRINHGPSESMLLSKLIQREGCNGRKALPLRCTLFQGERPRNSSDILMYIGKTSKKKKKSKTESSEGSRENVPMTNEDMHHDIVNKLNVLTLSMEKMRVEGYPMLIEGEEGKQNQSSEDQSEAISRLVNATKSLTNIDTNQDKDENNVGLVFDKVTSDEIVNSLAVEVVLKSQKQECPSSYYVTSCLLRHELLGHESMNVYSVDCEMVRTTEGFELARVTLLKLCPSTDDPEKYAIILDEYVKPQHHVVDYLTKYSGIKPLMLGNVTTTLEQVQATLLCIICKDDILIGQSLENDLKALRFAHFNVVDTAVLFRSSEGKKYSLKHLSAILLKQKIQGDYKNGHCSEEDAAASLILAVRRARLGITFKVQEKGKSVSLLSVINRLKKDSLDDRPPFFQYHHGPIVCIGPNEWLVHHVTSHSIASALQCDSISSSTVNAISSYLRPTNRRATLLWSRLCIGGNDMNAEGANAKVDELIVSNNLPTYLIIQLVLIQTNCIHNYPYHLA
jgi:DNA polymerase III, epsilon subunit and related 3''-5'' exonucleases